MIWGDKRYRSFNYEMKNIFKTKAIKLSLDGGFTCPNRDGTLGNKGCIFCGEEGSGEFTSSKKLDIKDQIKTQKDIMSKKWKDGKYIAYFQNFTNTYSDCKDLLQKYSEAITEEDIIGLAIATRPDCLSEDVLDVLEEINKKTFLWIELGLQTIHDKSSKFIRRGYPLEVYDKAVENLKKRDIKVVTHLIFGLPNETKEECLSSLKHVAKNNTWGVKLHLLYIQRDTDLYEYYVKNLFQLISMEEYVNLVADAIEYLPQDMVIHRLTGDGKRSLLVEPKWSTDKFRILSMIDMELARRDSYQGKYLKLF